MSGSWYQCSCFVSIFDSTSLSAGVGVETREAVHVFASDGDVFFSCTVQ